MLVWICGFFADGEMTLYSFAGARRFNPPTDPGVRALAAQLINREEKRLKQQKKELGGFLVGKTLGEVT